jgi:hypothetical protein
VLRSLIETAEPIADLFGTYYAEFQRLIDDRPGFGTGGRPST